MIFEGRDAAGKGGVIKRLTQRLNPRVCRVVALPAPTEREKHQWYFQRYVPHLPTAGEIALFDRSWYGRVLVERVEGFAQPEDWFRGYHEINEFEEQLVRHGIVLVKFWIHIDADEQLRRFKEREQVSYKQHKITDEDWRNREKWQDYRQAVNDMVERTSTKTAPWTLVEANDKYFARVKVLQTINERLEAELWTRRGGAGP